ncbi:radical SAM protein [Nonomuraea sp. NPDC052116]|uniref:radical SAM/SPASM domain-containing protein n=1 Tax=Nonomuraea sp. NPDC052116 TaxID=3155665 RepID=UPI0034285FC0
MSPLVRSRYLLLSPHEYRTQAGERVCLGYSTRTGRVFSVSPRTARLLETGALAELGQDVRDDLTRREILVPPQDELGSVLDGIRDTSARPGLRGFTIMPTAYCNMACSYCGQEHRKGSLRHERMERMIARVLAAMSDPHTGHVEVTWFGGEPLLGFRTIVEMSGRFLPAAARHGTRYSAAIITNGSLLDERRVDVLYEECGVRAIQVTLDGAADTHDRRRKMKNGRRTFGKIVALLSSVLAAGNHPQLRFDIRVNVDAENQDDIPGLLQTLAAHGLGHPSVDLDLMPVHSWGNDVSDVELTPAGYAEREAEWLALARSLGLRFRLLPTRRRSTTCLATTRNGELLDPSGAVYSCSEHPLVPRDRDSGVLATLDELATTALRPAGMFDTWYDEIEQDRWPCARCPFLPVCGGSCPKLWHDGAPPCPSYKFNWRQRLDLAAQSKGLVRCD